MDFAVYFWKSLLYSKQKSWSTSVYRYNFCHLSFMKEEKKKLEKKYVMMCRPEWGWERRREVLTQKWHSWALNMRKPTRVDFILVCFKKNRFSFQVFLFLKLIFGTQKKGGRDREVSSPQCGRVLTKLCPFPSHQDSRTAPSSSVPLSDQLQHLTDGDGLTWEANK